MLEIGEYVPSLPQVLMYACYHGLSFFRRIFRLAIAVIAEVRSNYIRCNALLSLGNAQRPIVFFQKIENRISEPGS